MAQPTQYQRSYSFAGFQATQPNKPLPGNALDNELENVENSVNQAITAINDIRRADGALRNGIVTADALAVGLVTGVNPATEWQTGIQYQAQDTVFFGSAFYRCESGHVSAASFSTDLSAGRWVRYANLAPIVDDAAAARDQAVISAAAASSSASTASTAATTATGAANSTAALYDLFDDRYLGEKTSLPTLDNDGNALVNGTLVSLTGQSNPLLNGMYVRRSGAWQFVIAQAQGVFMGYRYVATGGQTTFSGADANGNSLSYVVGAILVTVNGSSLAPNAYTAVNGTSVVFGTALSAGDTVVIYSFGSFTGIDLSYLDPDLPDPYNANGLAAPVTMAAIARGEIKLREQYGIVVGAGISPTDRVRNKARLYTALQEASIERRPLLFPRNQIVEMDCSTGGILIDRDNVEVNLNGGVLRHAGTENSTVIQVQKVSALISNFKMYNGTIDGNAQGGKTNQFYLLAGLFHTGTYLEDLTFLDPFGCGMIWSDSYSTPGRPYPNMPSSNMLVRNCRTQRSSANRTYMTTFPAMFQSDQCVITHVDGLMIDGYRGEISGMSGISLGLSRNVTFRRGQFDACGASVYCETLTGFTIDDVSVVNHQNWQGDAAANPFNTAAVYLTDGDLSTPGGLFGSCRDGSVNNVRITSISRSNTGGDFKGVLVTGRDGASRVAQNIRVSNVNARGLGGGQIGASAVTLEGQLTNVSVEGVAADNCSIAVRLNSSYTTFGGAAANLMTGCVIGGVTASACGYSFYGAGSDPSHVSSFIAGPVRGGGAAIVLPDSLGLQGYVP